MLPIAGSLGSRLVLRLLLLQCADASRAPACSSKMEMNVNYLRSAPSTLLILWILYDGFCPAAIMRTRCLDDGGGISYQVTSGRISFQLFLFARQYTSQQSFKKKVLHCGAQYLASHHQCSSS